MLARTSIRLRRLWHGAGVVKSILGEVRQPNVADTVAIERHLSLAATPEELAQFSAVLASNPVLAEMLRERWTPKPFSLSDLAVCAPGTLGQRYRAHMLDNNLKPDFYPDIPADRVVEYLRGRMYQTHDYWHALTGFGTSEADEVGIVGFYLGQIGQLGDAGIGLSVAVGVLFSSTLLNVSLFRPTLLPQMFQRFNLGYEHGARALPLFGLHWEELWHEPLSTLRARYGLQALPALLQSSANAAPLAA